MLLQSRIESFVKLGEMLREFPENSEDLSMQCLTKAAKHAEADNPWFTEENIRYALNSLGEALWPQKIEKWLAPYMMNLIADKKYAKVAVVMAGNIPAVGFHDFLCVLISGHEIIVKLSSQDKKLLPAMAEMLIRLNHEWIDQINFTIEKLPAFQVIIATGASNTFRYFEYYFRNYPYMIRHNRNSIAILTGNENKSQFAGLADDMMKFFGLGCRNVSKLYVPKGYDFSALIKELEPYRWQADHSKFRNNYDYYKSIYLVNKNPFYDNGFLLLTSSSRLNSPIGVVNFEEYSEFHNLDQRINEERKFIQCIVCTRNFGLNSVLPGQTQQPELWDYADGVDTMDFLQRLTFD